jgi:hypothetical protein
LKNRVLRRIFGPKRKEIAGSWGRLHNEELHNLYTSPHVIRVIRSRKMRWVGHTARIWDMKIAYRDLVGEPEWKRHLEVARARKEANFKMTLKGNRI